MGSFEVCYSFVGFVYVYCLIHQNEVVFCLVFHRKITARFFSNAHVSFLKKLYLLISVMFFKCSSSLCILICECACLFFAFVVEVLFSFFCICWVERNFFSLTVFDENLLAGDVYSSVALDRHVQDMQRLPTHLRPTLAISACSLEAWGRNGIFLLLPQIIVCG